MYGERRNVICLISCYDLRAMSLLMLFMCTVDIINYNIYRTHPSHIGDPLFFGPKNENNIVSRSPSGQGHNSQVER